MKYKIQFAYEVERGDVISVRVKGRVISDDPYLNDEVKRSNWFSYADYEKAYAYIQHATDRIREVLIFRINNYIEAEKLISQWNGVTKIEEVEI